VKLSIRDITHTGIFTALTSIGAFISIPIGPVPITLQTFFVLLSGIILGSKKALLSQISYVLLGLMGLPIFAGFSGGLQTIFKPSFGFLAGCIIAAYCVGKFIENKPKTIKNMSFSVMIGTIIIYAIGLPYMYFILNIMLASNLTTIKILEIGMLLFIPGDVLKAATAVLIGKNLQGKLNK